MRKTTLIFVFILALCACSKEAREIAYANQARQIETYINNALKADETAKVVYNNGVARLIAHGSEEGEGEGLNSRGTVTFEYAAYDFSNSSIAASTLISTNRKELAKSSGFSVSDTALFKPVTLDLSRDNMIDGLRLGLAGVKKNQVSTILFSGKYGFGDTYNGTVKRNSPLAYQLWILDILN